MADTIEKTSIPVRLSLIFPLILVTFARGLKQISRKIERNRRLSDKDLVKKLLTSNRIFRLLVNNFLTRSLSESRLRWTCCFHFLGGIRFKPHANLITIHRNTEVNISCFPHVILFNSIAYNSIK